MAPFSTSAPLGRLVDTGLLRNAGFWVDVLGGVALLALAVVVARVRPRRAVNVAFAGYAAAVGLAMVGVNLFHFFERYDAGNWWFISGVAVGGAFLMAVGVLLDRTVAVKARRVWPILAACATPYVVERTLAMVFFGPSGPFSELGEALQAIAFTGVFFLVALLALRTRQRAWTMPPWIAALLTVGVVAAPAFDAVPLILYYLAFSVWQAALVEAFLVVAFLVLGGIWLAVSPRVGRPAVVAGLACFTFPALGAVVGAAPSGSALEGFYFNGSLGVVTLLGVGTLAYAIVRHQLFDIDVRLKRGLRGSTVAAIFVAVFFAVSEGAQAFFESRTGSTAVGIGATALLLFAIAPLQRLGDQVAARALPGVRGDDPAYLLDRKRETYRNAYAAAWADGILTPKDARLLAEFKEALGLPAKEYAAIEREWAAGAPKA